ncbi:MAG: CPBP family intramembrane glutamic endopeptidase [Candidatus Saccharibacteria bacterium]
MSADSGANPLTPVVDGTKTIKLKHRPLGPWDARDAFIALCAVTIAPFAIALTFYILGRVSILPQSIASLFIAENPVATLVQYLTALTVEVGLIGLLMHYKQASLQALGVRSFKWRWLLAVLGLYVAQAILVIIVFTLIQVLSPKVNLDEAQDVFEFGKTNWAVIGTFISAVIIAPILEEIIFRGIIYVGLTKIWPRWVSAVLTAILFGWLHAQLNVGIYTFLLGLLLTWLYVKSRSLIPGIILHMLNNAVAFWLLLGPK